METVSNEHTLYTALPYNKSASYVNVMRKFLLADNSITVKEVVLVHLTG